MAESILQQQLKYFSDNQSGPRFTIIHGNRLKGYSVFSNARFIFITSLPWPRQPGYTGISGLRIGRFG